MFDKIKQSWTTERIDEVWSEYADLEEKIKQ